DPVDVDEAGPWFAGAPPRVCAVLRRRVADARASGYGDRDQDRDAPPPASTSTRSHADSVSGIGRTFKPRRRPRGSPRREPPARMARRGEAAFKIDDGQHSLHGSGKKGFLGAAARALLALAETQVNAHPEPLGPPGQVGAGHDLRAAR